MQQPNNNLNNAARVNPTFLMVVVITEILLVAFYLFMTM